jgi:hypothetical protein
MSSTYCNKKKNKKNKCSAAGDIKSKYIYFGNKVRTTSKYWAVGEIPMRMIAVCLSAHKSVR